MKKIICFLAFAGTLTGFSQSFDKGKVVASLNYDFGVYATTSTDKKTGTTDDDGAAANIYSLSGEYGVLPWLGVGARFAAATYLTGTDSATGVRGSGNSFDFGVLVNAHVLRKEKFDLPVGVSFGGSSFTYKNNLSDNGTAKDFGTVTNFYVNPRFYFGSSAKFGLNLRLGYALYNYPSVDFTSNNSQDPDAIKFTERGVNVGVGFQMKF